VIHTLRETLGDEAFWKGINTYLDRHKFSSVETTDLQKAMEEASGKKLDWFFEQWVYGVGIPKLDVKQAYNARSKTLRITVTQTQPIGKGVTAAYRLPMNVEIKTASGVKSEKIEVTKRSQIFSLKTGSKPIGIVFDKEDKIPLKTVKIHPLPAR
jgi:aminopeptidase N